MPRPALVISRSPLGPDGLLIWTLMITNAQREDWPGDVLIPNADQVGLLIPSKVRTAKIAPIEISRASLIGRVDDKTLRLVQTIVRESVS